MKTDGLILLMLGGMAFGGLVQNAPPVNSAILPSIPADLPPPIAPPEPLKQDQVGNIGGALAYGTRVQQKKLNNPNDYQIGYVVGVVGVTGNQTYDVQFPGGIYRVGENDIQVI